VSDAITIPIAVVAPAISALVSHFKAKRIERRLEIIEKAERDCMARLLREIERGARHAAIQVDPFNPPQSLPPPEWDEPTPLRTIRAELEAKGLAAGVRDLLAEYLERTPPKVYR
jgi:hypothetical protein